MEQKEEILRKLENISTIEELESFHQKYLGKKWEISLEFKTLWKLPPEERKSKWQMLSSLKEEVEEKYEQIKQKIKKNELNTRLSNDPIDITTPSPYQELWKIHPLQDIRRKAEETLKALQFDIIYSNSLEDNDNIKDFLFTNNLSSKTAIVTKNYQNNKNLPLLQNIHWIIIKEDLNLGNLKNLVFQIVDKIFEKKITTNITPFSSDTIMPGIKINTPCFNCTQKGCKLCNEYWFFNIIKWGIITPSFLEKITTESNKYKWIYFTIDITKICLIKFHISNPRLITNEYDLKFLKTLQYL